MKIADLSARACWESESGVRPQIKRTALDYALMSDYTSFVAVDSLTRTSGDYGTTVAVPVPMPDGVKYETTVSDESGPRR
jgi:Ca-activated chloride channel family protein